MHAHSNKNRECLLPYICHFANVVDPLTGQKIIAANLQGNYSPFEGGDFDQLEDEEEIEVDWDDDDDDDDYHEKEERGRVVGARGGAKQWSI